MSQLQGVVRYICPSCEKLRLVWRRPAHFLVQKSGVDMRCVWGSWTCLLPTIASLQVLRPSHVLLHVHEPRYETCLSFTFNGVAWLGFLLRDFHMD